MNQQLSGDAQLARAVANEPEAKLRRVLGLPSLIFFGLVYMVPLTVYDTYGIVSSGTAGRTSLAYLITLAAMTFTAISYGKMVRKFPVAGSAYSFASKSFGPNLGFLTGWLLLLDYVLLPLVNYLLIGVYLHEVFPSIPFWVFAVACIVLVTALNIIGITTVAMVSNIIVIVQLVFIAVFVLLAITYVTGNGNPVDFAAPFRGIGGEGADLSSLLAGSAVLCLSFLGFDAISTLVEEAKRPLRDIPRAIIVVTVGAGLLFVLISYLSQLVMPGTDFQNEVAAGNEVMDLAGGGFLIVFFLSAYVAGTVGSAIAAQASVSRVLFSMGRDGMLPRSFFGYLSPRFKTPVRAILLVSVISVAGIGIDADLLFSIVSFGALVAFSMVNLSVIRQYFFVDRLRGPSNTLRYLVAPLVGFLLTGWIWTSLQSNAIIIGLSWLAVGLVYLAVLTRGFRRRAPETEDFSA
ncbi:APC family permease [Leucobacter sp. M11]|uniref:APC family permease n=1 Tax=Leucobacter sp. M11 TaxID=2993565 RepID=UPI002D807235|nr:APC family permease [Leucobacter sp. M11]MEB4616002.1 APC family permease [Leucobacter sp. M11]